MKATSYMKILDFATELYTNGDSKNTWGMHYISVWSQTSLILVLLQAKWPYSTYSTFTLLEFTCYIPAMVMLNLSDYTHLDHP